MESPWRVVEGGHNVGHLTRVGGQEVRFIALHLRVMTFQGVIQK